MKTEDESWGEHTRSLGVAGRASRSELSVAVALGIVRPDAPRGRGKSRTLGVRCPDKNKEMNADMTACGKRLPSWGAMAVAPLLARIRLSLFHSGVALRFPPRSKTGRQFVGSQSLYRNFILAFETTLCLTNQR
jgi:hypothetical protein